MACQGFHPFLWERNAFSTHFPCAFGWSSRLYLWLRMLCTSCWLLPTGVPPPVCWLASIPVSSLFLCPFFSLFLIPIFSYFPKINIFNFYRNSRKLCIIRSKLMKQRTPTACHSHYLPIIVSYKPLLTSINQILNINLCHINFRTWLTSINHILTIY